MTFKELKEFFDITLNKEKWEVPIVRLFTQDEVEAMLTNIQSEIEKLDSRAGYDGGGMPTFVTDYIRKKKVNELIQEKINALKAESENKE